MRATIRGPGRYDVLNLSFICHVHEVLQAYALSWLAMAGYAGKIGLAASAMKEILASLVHRALLWVVQRDVHLHPVRPGSDVKGQGLHIRAVAHRRADRRLDDFFAL